MGSGPGPKPSPLQAPIPLHQDQQEQKKDEKSQSVVRKERDSEATTWSVKEGALFAIHGTGQRHAYPLG